MAILLLWNGGALAAEGQLVVYATGPYEVWGGSQPSSQYYDIDTDPAYVKLGDGIDTAPFPGGYAYYVVATHSLISLDALQLPNGRYIEGESNSPGRYVTWGNVHRPWEFAAFGESYCGNGFCGTCANRNGCLKGSVTDYVHDAYIYGSPDGRSDDVGHPAGAGTTGGHYEGFVVAENPPCAKLSGTIRYKGRMGPVSSSQPIGIGMFRRDDGSFDEVDRTFVDSTGGAFTLCAPSAGDYYLYYFLDVHDYRDGSASVGGPLEVYNNRYPVSFPDFTADPVSVPRSGLTLEFDDTLIVPGIAGSVTYTGSQGPVGERCIVVQAYTDPRMTGAPAADYGCAQTDGRYELILLDTNTMYYLRAFLDGNDNEQLDSGEPFGVYDGTGSLTAAPVLPSTTQTHVDFSFADEHVTPNPCAGDCDASGEVTVNELVTLVNIALGNAQLSACTAGDTNGSGAIAINEIVAAVARALKGCAG